MKLNHPESQGRFNWLERDNDDFPYYNGSPVNLSGGQWLLIMVAVAAGFAFLIYPPPFLRSGLLKLVPSIMFSVIPLAVLAMFAGGHWKALFRRLRARDFGWMILFFILNWIVTLGAGLIIVNFFEHTANPAGDTLMVASAADKGMFLVRTAIQLFGEEVFTILPFLAILYWCTAKFGMSRKMAIVLAWLGSAVIFSAAHLPTYDWHVPQALIGVGAARLVLTLPYIMTKNIWVSTGAHILNDWAIFGLPVLLASMQS